MNQKKSDKFKQLYKKLSEDECWERAEKAAKHLLTAIAFKETSQICYRKTDSVLLPPIGYYYSVFHMSVCLCWLNPEIPSKKLEKLKHSVLQSLIGSHYINQNILDSSYADLMQELKEEREWLNYTFGEFEYDLFEKVKQNYSLVNSEFEKAIQIINEICNLLLFKYNIRERMKIYIADSKGDDFMQTYLSVEERDSVVKYLVDFDLTN